MTLRQYKSLKRKIVREHSERVRALEILRDLLISIGEWESDDPVGGSSERGGG